MKTSLILSMLCMSTLSWAGVDRGNGGDPLRFDFETGRQQLIQRISAIQPCSFSANVSEDVRQWISNNKTQLVADIKASQHVWITDAQSTCAFTQITANADIIFSFEACRPGIHDAYDAGKLLAHETVHHFGISEESFADRVAEAIYSAGSNSSCGVPPAADPFDAASCPGNHLTAGELKDLVGLPVVNETVLGQYNVTGRKRVCYGQDFCGPWKADSSAFYYNSISYDSQFNVNLPMSSTGSVSARLVGNKPIVYVKADIKYQDGPHVQPSPSFSFSAQIIDSKMTFEGGSNLVRSGDYPVAAARMTGWITNTCYRQVYQTVDAGKDQFGNDITSQYEVVFLSQFGK